MVVRLHALEDARHRHKHTHRHGQPHDDDELGRILVKEERRDPERQPHRHRPLQHQRGGTGPGGQAPARDKAGVLQRAVGKGQRAQAQHGHQQHATGYQGPERHCSRHVELPHVGIALAQGFAVVLRFGRRVIANGGRRIAAVVILARLLLGGRHALFSVDALADAGHKVRVLVALRVDGEPIGQRRDEKKRQQRVDKDLGKARAECGWKMHGWDRLVVCF